MLLVDISVLRGGARNHTGRTGRGREFGQAEIQDLGVAALGDENVRGLDIAVHDVLRVGGIERIRDLDGQRTAVSPVPSGGRQSDASALHPPDTPWR